MESSRCSWGNKWLLTAIAVLAAGTAYGQEPTRLDSSRLLRNWVETGMRYHNVTNGFGDWKGAYVRASVAQGQRDVWYGEAWYQEAFRDDGRYVGLTNTHTWSDQWYSHVGIGAGSGDFFYPRWRLDASLGKKWLASRNLVTTFGVSYIEAMHNNRDRALTGSVIYYFNDRLVGEIGGRFNWSDPGSVPTQRIFASITYGRAKERYLVLRAGGGEEGYQIVGPTTTKVNFTSEEASLTWREWLGPDWGTNVVLETYDNPYYTRNGVTAGVFYEW